MKKIAVATISRGFLGELFKFQNPNYKFILNDKNKFYETNSFKKEIASKVVRHPIADYLGLVQRIDFQSKDSDIIFSFNRFLKSNKDYVIYLENPLALVHYSIERPSRGLSKKKVKKYLNDPKLKAIVCLSKACYTTLHHFYDIPDSIRVEQIYPLIKTDSKFDNGHFNNKYLYISSNFKLKGGREILEAFDEIYKKKLGDPTITIVTRLESLTKEELVEISSRDYIKLFDFVLSKEEMKKLYKEASVLLNPTRQDSFPMVVLEAMKFGNVIMSTDLYGIPEMVEEGYNGFLTAPRHRFFEYNNMPNKKVWNDRKNTIYKDFIDYDIVKFLKEKIIYLNDNSELANEMKYNSYIRANNIDFSETKIIDRWTKVFESIN